MSITDLQTYRANARGPGGPKNICAIDCSSSGACIVYEKRLCMFRTLGTVLHWIS